MLRDRELNTKIIDAAIEFGMTDEEIDDLVGIISEETEAVGIIDFLKKNPNATPREMTRERRRILGRPM